MDYRESTMSLGITDKLLCPCCGSQQHSVKSVITYAFYFFEYLPIFPVKRETRVQCLQCQHPANSASDRKLIFSDLSLAFFNKLRLLSTFTGSVLIIILLSYYFSDEQQKNRQSQAYIDAPKVNDFYYLDYRKVTGDKRPQNNYRIAKIVDITGGTVSLTYGNYFYPMKNALNNGVVSVPINSAIINTSRAGNRLSNLGTIGVTRIVVMAAIEISQPSKAPLCVMRSRFCAISGAV